MPAIDLTTTGINLHSGDYFNATLTYDGSNLTLTLTDAITLATWSHVFVVNIPAIVGGNTAYVGFTGGTGGLTSSQKLTSWTYVPGPPLPSYATGFTPGSMTLNGGAAITANALELTDGNPNETRSAFFTTPVNIQQFITNFQFQLLNPNSDGFTFTIQGNAPTALGWGGVIWVTAAFSIAWLSSSICLTMRVREQTPPACTSMVQHQRYPPSTSRRLGSICTAETSSTRNFLTTASRSRW